MVDSKLIDKRQELNNQIATLQRELSALNKDIASLCDHSKVTTGTYYVEGSYYNKAEYHTTVDCWTCGKRLKDEYESGSYG